MSDKGFNNLVAAVLGMAIAGVIVCALYVENCQAAPHPGDFERIKYATALEKAFQANGYDVWTAAYGDKKDSLLIKCAMFVDSEIVIVLIRESVVQWMAFGFKEVLITSGEVTVFVDVQKAWDIVTKKARM